MKITWSFEDTKLIVSLEGRLDTLTSQDLLAELDEPLKKAEKIEFDFAALEYVSSAGLRALLTCQKQVGGKDNIVLKNVNPVVQNIFKVTGFAKLLTII